MCVLAHHLRRYPATIRIFFCPQIDKIEVKSENSCFSSLKVLGLSRVLLDFMDLLYFQLSLAREFGKFNCERVSHHVG